MLIFLPNMRRFVYFSARFVIFAASVGEGRIQNDMPNVVLSSVSTSDHCGLSIEFRPLKNIGSGIIIWTPELALRSSTGLSSGMGKLVSLRSLDMLPPPTPWLLFSLKSLFLPRRLTNFPFLVLRLFFKFSWVDGFLYLFIFVRTLGFAFCLSNTAVSFSRLLLDKLYVDLALSEPS